MGWVKRKADEHKHDMPKNKNDPNMKEVTIGDIWECTCKVRFRFSGWDTGVQWDSYPAVAKWIPVSLPGEYDR